MEENLTLKTTKNVGWNFATKLITKFGGLIFTILIARLLTPELFGTYSLVLSLFIITLVFTDLGIGNALVRYLSYYIGKKQIQKARSYFRYLLKIKFLLVISSVLILIFLSKFLAYNIFNKPIILLPILFSCFYILTTSISNFFKEIFIAKKDLSKLFILETIFEISKIFFTILAIYILSNEFIVSGIFIALAFASFLTFLFSLFLVKKDSNIIFGKTESVERKRIFSYLKSMSLVSLSLVFFGSIDTLMLGYFVDMEFIGFYKAALNLIITTSALFAFSNILLPVFTQMHDNNFEKAFNKIMKYLLILTIPSFIGIAIISKYFILTIYGSEYLTATNSLYILAPIILISPFVVLYSSIFQAKEKTNIIAKGVIISLIINIILNYILIKSFLIINQEYAIMGAGLATVISRGFYLTYLANKSYKNFKTKINWEIILKSFFASGVMALFLIYFSYFIDMNIYFGILEIFLGAGIYFAIMFLIKGIKGEDLNLVKDLIKR
jgi:O-antigen/teichoic acid export membrane protein